MAEMRSAGVGDEPSRAEPIEQMHRPMCEGFAGRRSAESDKQKTIHLIGQLWLERSFFFNSPEVPLRRLARANPDDMGQSLSSSACRGIVGQRAVREP
ncbi:hypothetical protein JCM24511_08055 [Saitozyma sp. JCM 24511]|nr:hypothetical protein JCM24511_08055 [Saitozyma sp. JCM 24511]